MVSGITLEDADVMAFGFSLHAGPLPPPERDPRRRLIQYMCLYGDRRRLPIDYTMSFLAIVVSFVGGSIAWICYFWLAVDPFLRAEDDPGCRSSSTQLAHNAHLLQIYFLWFAVARIILFIPGFVARIARIQARSHGSCFTFFVRLIIRDGPVCIFCVAAFLFWFDFFRAPVCNSDNTNVLFQAWRIYSSFSCAVAFACIILVSWHNKLISMSIDAGFQAELRRRAEQAHDTVHKLSTVVYNASLFGDEDEKPFPGECVICLGNWEPEDVIKITPCTLR